MEKNKSIESIEKIITNLIKKIKLLPFKEFEKNIKSNIKYYRELNCECDIIFEEILDEMNTWSFQDVLKDERERDLISEFNNNMLKEIKKRLDNKKCKNREILFLEKEYLEEKIIYGAYLNSFHNVFNVLKKKQHRGIILCLFKKNIFEKLKQNERTGKARHPFLEKGGKKKDVKD